MQNKLHKRSILKKTFQFSFLTFISRILGAIREVLQVRLLGVGAFSDAFIMAFRIPNSLRKVFAEGALSSAFVPVFIKIATADEKKEGNRLMLSAFLFFEGIVLLLCLYVWFFPHTVINLVASGFNTEQYIFAVKYLRILFPFIFFVSSSALLAGALQAENHFFMPAFAPILLNIFFIGSLLTCLHYNFSITFLCYGILAGGLIQLLLYFLFYKKCGYSFSLPTHHTWMTFKSILKKFGNCLFGVSIMELNLIIDGNIASHASAGAPTVLYYGSRFMQIPLGIFAVAFSTIMLSYFSRVLIYAPRRLNFLLLEVTKFVCWSIIPAMLYLMFISHRLFASLIMSKNVSPLHIWQSQWVLIIFCAGLLFFSLNKIVTNIFYAFGDTWTPTLVGIIATLVNAAGNIISIMVGGEYAIFGIAASTTFSGIVFTFFSFVYLYKHYKMHFSLQRFFSFIIRYGIQMICGCALFLFAHCFFMHIISHTSLHHFFINEWGYFLFSLPLVGAGIGFLFFTRNLFGIKLYFL